jgi:hypothetical protein
MLKFRTDFQWQLLPNRCYLLGGLSVGTLKKEQNEFRRLFE